MKLYDPILGKKVDVTWQWPNDATSFAHAYTSADFKPVCGQSAALGPDYCVATESTAPRDRRVCGQCTEFLRDSLRLRQLDATQAEYYSLHATCSRRSFTIQITDQFGDKVKCAAERGGVLKFTTNWNDVSVAIADAARLFRATVKEQMVREGYLVVVSGFRI